ncbi:GCN5-related N-acetyltransferase [Naegleria gruberi]|uniref:GCN5-related N-acetyltransferase n=1 Tax=Naegleria gruberi TaxID=5762 RepID=D2V5M0_NAEGR|nr:GCN5-related N-acetyltransferase [Naegleria gruberi]EFC47824.1 GCN5-related N-acetyltransferase [Naegleria gruberi]|eukprot:XP_002680568.1 GCN5-related N-acetyltransferase [Naegleria gruberi strain NEG-M]
MSETTSCTTNTTYSLNSIINQQQKKLEQENADISYSIFEMNQIMVRAIPTLSDLQETEKESINCIKPGYEELDEPNPTYTCRDDITNFELIDLVEKQAKRSLVYLFLPDTKCKTLLVENGRVEQQTEKMVQEGLLDSEGRLTKYQPLYERLGQYVTDYSVYHGMIYYLREEETSYMKSKKEMMQNTMGYKGILQPFQISNGENVVCQLGNDFVMKIVETREELIQVIDCMQETFTDFKSGPLTAEVMNNTYPLHSDEFSWICIKDLATNEIATTGQVFFGPRTCYGSNLCTKPKYRGKGFATVMMIAMLELAKTRKDKYEYIVIQASLDGLPIYDKLGYEYRFDFEIMELNPQANSDEQDDAAATTVSKL